jgi:carbonic anhydrase
LPALEGVDPDLEYDELMTQAVEANVRWTMRQILESPEGQTRLREGRMKMAGAIYELASGRVRFLEDDPPGR